MSAAQPSRKPPAPPTIDFATTPRIAATNTMRNSARRSLASRSRIAAFEPSVGPNAQAGQREHAQEPAPRVVRRGVVVDPLGDGLVAEEQNERDGGEGAGAGDGTGSGHGRNGTVAPTGPNIIRTVR